MGISLVIDRRRLRGWLCVVVLPIFRRRRRWRREKCFTTKYHGRFKQGSRWLRWKCFIRFNYFMGLAVRQWSRCILYLPFIFLFIR